MKRKILVGLGIFLAIDVLFSLVGGGGSGSVPGKETAAIITSWALLLGAAVFLAIIVRRAWVCSRAAKPTGLKEGSPGSSPGPSEEARAAEFSPVLQVEFGDKGPRILSPNGGLPVGKNVYVKKTSEGATEVAVSTSKHFPQQLLEERDKIIQRMGGEMEQLLCTLEDTKHKHKKSLARERKLRAELKKASCPSSPMT